MWPSTSSVPKQPRNVSVLDESAEMSDPKTPDRSVGVHRFLVFFVLFVAFPVGVARCAQQPAQGADAARQDPGINAPAAIKLNVSRWGRCLSLQLREGDGRRLSRKRGGPPPQFAVFRNGQEIGTGSFEYG